MYTLGIDLGTTYTAAAVHRDGRAEVVSLGSRVAATPSVVLVRDDQTVLTGEAANRRAVLEPHRVAREFKRRLGDSTPILLGGSPFSAEALTARLLRSTFDEVVTREGSRPGAVCITHPANWGPFKTDLLLQAVRIAGLDGDLDCLVSLVTEPEAAAAHYAQQQRIAAGSLVAVYDLGGGTFDAAVLRKTETGFGILGHPEGIERLGGIDVDAAVFGHVVQAIGSSFAELDDDDPSVLAAVARLREECVQAKEALSADTDVSIPVLLPGISTEVRLTRGELETMIRPALSDSVESLKRALANAGVQPAELHSVLLVGGSSRIPLVAQLVGELGRPVTVDTHPKNAVALGAAWLAAQPAVASVGPVADPVASPVASPVAGPVAGAMVGPRTAQTELIPAVPRQLPGVFPTPGHGTSVLPAAGFSASPESVTPRRPALSRGIFGGIGALILIGGGVTVAATYTGRPDAGSKPSATGISATTTDPLAGIPAAQRCTDQIKANPRWVCLTSASFDGLNLTVRYESEFAGSEPNGRTGYHLHVYGSDGSTRAESMGQQASNPGHWYVSTDNPSVKRATSQAFGTVIGDSPQVCARIANAGHGLVPDLNGGYETGNCVPIVRTAAGSATQEPTRKAPRSTGDPTGSPTPTSSPTDTSIPTPTGSPTGTLTAPPPTLPLPTGTALSSP